MHGHIAFTLVYCNKIIYMFLWFSRILQADPGTETPDKGTIQCNYVMK